MAAHFSADRRVAAEWEPQECLWMHGLTISDLARTFKTFHRYFPLDHLVSGLTGSRPGGCEVARQCQRMIGTSKHAEIIDIPTDGVRDWLHSSSVIQELP